MKGRSATGWQSTKWGALATLEYGKSLRDYDEIPTEEKPIQVFGTNGPIGWHSEALYPKSGIVIGRKGAYRGVHFSAKPFFVIDTAFYLKPKIPFDIRWAYYALKNFDINNIDSGSAIPSTSREAFYEIPVQLPPADAQRRIADVLFSYDELIENDQRRIAILEEMTRALYREWFVEFRFSGNEKVQFVQSPLGNIPRGWEVKSLSEIAEVNRAQISPRNAPADVHYIDIASVSPGQIDVVTTYPFSDAPGRARRIVQHGDVLWSCVRPNRRSHALVLFPQPDTIASTGFAVLTARAAPYTFLYQVTTSDEFVAYLTNNATGAAYPAVTASTFEKAKVVVPAAELLQRFADVTVPMAEQAHCLRQQVFNLRKTRDLLIPRLLSGENFGRANAAGEIECAEVA